MVRHSFLLATACAMGAPASGQAPIAHDAQEPFVLGADLSARAWMEQAGAAFRDEAKPGHLIGILAGHGWNMTRLRLFVAPNHEGPVVNDLPYTLALATRARAAGMRLMLDIHYSDTWADPTHQHKPAAWEGQDFETLVQTMHAYTASVIESFKANGTVPEIVQIGNEITPGFLWPDGKLVGDDGIGTAAERWARFARLLKARIQGAREAAAGADMRVMVHVDRGGDWGATQWFFEHLAQRGVDYDLIGQSYYPFRHGTLEDLRTCLRNTAEVFGKDMMVVETAYPHAGEEWWSKYRMAWPISPEGQAAFLRDLVEVVGKTPNGHGVGVLYWYPEAIRVEGLDIRNGGVTALFGSDGNVLPGVPVPKTDGPAGTGPPPASRAAP